MNWPSIRPRRDSRDSLRSLRSQASPDQEERAFSEGEAQRKLYGQHLSIENIPSPTASATILGGSKAAPTATPAVEEIAQIRKQLTQLTRELEQARKDLTRAEREKKDLERVHAQKNPARTFAWPHWVQPVLWVVLITFGFLFVRTVARRPDGPARLASKAPAPASVTPTVTKINLPPPAHVYTIQVSLSDQEDAAKRWSQDLRRRGYTTSVTPVQTARGKSLWRVDVGQYESVQAAQEALAQLKTREKINDSFVRRMS